MSSTASDGPSGIAAAATAHSSVTLADGSFAYALHETLGVGANAKVKVGIHNLHNGSTTDSGQYYVLQL
jgi:hypothetical protein